MTLKRHTGNFQNFRENQTYWWPSVGKEIKYYIRKCKICQVTQYPKKNRWDQYIYWVNWPTYFLGQRTQNKIIQFLEEQVFLMFGVPFVAIQKQLLLDYDVEPLYSASYHPQANSVERMNRSVKTAIRKYVIS